MIATTLRDQTLIELAHKHPTAYARVIQPGYEAAPVHWAIGDALRRATQPDATDQERRIMIFMPPQNGKSQLVSVDFPAWYLGNFPDNSVMALSYGSQLATDFGLEARNQIRSNVYRAIFPGVTVSPESSARARWAIAGRRGLYRASGIRGTITGRGADVLLIDDPIADVIAAYSADNRQLLWDWYTGTVYTRLRPGAILIVIQTRWHEDDLAGRLLEAAERGGEYADRWTVLRFPALAEPDDPLGRVEGEALLPNRYPVDALRRIQSVTGTEMWEALYMQRPQPDEGTRFQRGWFNTIAAAPGHLEWVRYWDLAQTDEQAAQAKNRAASYTASVAVALDLDGKLYIRDAIRGRWEWPDARAKMIETFQIEKESTRQAVEQAMHGKTALQEFQRMPEIAGVPFMGITVDRSKLIRAMTWQGRAANGDVHLVRNVTPGLAGLVEPDWIDTFLDEVATFPLGRFDDQVDSVSGGMEIIGGAGSGVSIDPLAGQSDDPDDAENRADRLRREAREAANPDRRQRGTIARGRGGRVF